VFKFMYKILYFTDTTLKWKVLSEEDFMKATGIVRRIDELGRIVIPKEIRKTLRIRQMDSIEIYTSGDDEIILKKYTPLGEIRTIAGHYAESMAKISGNIICVTDKENVVAVSGGGKKELESALVSKQLLSAMADRRSILAANTDADYVPVTGAVERIYAWQVISPIISDADVLGCVIMLGKDGKYGTTEEKMVAVAADFMGRYLAA
jgi:AbrB family transcriptional regulator (stage V sporulation protein T)